jgi:hypothetical protein
MRVPFASLTAVALAGLVAVGCGGGVVDPSDNKVETFSNTVEPGGAAFSSFSISRRGEFAVTLVSLTPPASIPVVAWLANFISGQCVAPPIQENTFATAGRIVLSGPIEPGNYCVAILDRGVMTVPETYVIQVSHP